MNHQHLTCIHTHIHIQTHSFTHSNTYTYTHMLIKKNHSIVESCLHYICCLILTTQVVGSWTNYSNTLGLSSLICKSKMINPILYNCCADKIKLFIWKGYEFYHCPVLFQHIHTQDFLALSATPFQISESPTYHLRTIAKIF